MADYHLPSGLADHEDFDYDKLGNRLEVDGYDEGTAFTDVYSLETNNPANQYATVDGQSVSYDDAGNFTLDAAGYVYTYDAENRITTITNSSLVVVAQFTYDALGRRVQTVADGQTRQYYYDGWRVLTEVVDRADPDPDIEYDYLWGNYLDEALVRVEDSAAGDPCCYLLHDHLYSPMALLDGTGAVIERYDYDAYGRRHVWPGPGIDGQWYTGDDPAAQPTSPQDLATAFTGQRLDFFDVDNLALMYYKNRYYDPETGRFLTRDPLGVVPNAWTPLYRGEIFAKLSARSSADVTSPHGDNHSVTPRSQYWDGLSLYRYGGNSPSVTLDPVGYKSTSDCPNKKRRPGYQPTTNGCGRKKEGPVVKGGMWALQKRGKVNFTPSCNQHDLCYQNCGSTRKLCDQAFRNNMNIQCLSNYTNTSPWLSLIGFEPEETLAKCLQAAEVFYHAVRVGGKDAYDRNQEAACVCCE